MGSSSSKDLRPAARCCRCVVCIMNEAAMRNAGATQEEMVEVVRQEWDELERR